MNRLITLWSQLGSQFKKSSLFRFDVGGIIVIIVLFILVRIFNTTIDGIWKNRVEPTLSNLYVISVSGYCIIGLVIILITTALFFGGRYLYDQTWKKTIKTTFDGSKGIEPSLLTSTDLIKYANLALKEINRGIVNGECLKSYLEILPGAINRGIITEDNARNMVDQLGYRMKKMPDGKILFSKKESRVRRGTR